MLFPVSQHVVVPVGRDLNAQMTRSTISNRSYISNVFRGQTVHIKWRLNITRSICNRERPKFKTRLVFFCIVNNSHSYNIFGLRHLSFDITRLLYKRNLRRTSWKLNSDSLFATEEQPKFITRQATRTKAHTRSINTRAPRHPAISTAATTIIST